MASFFYTIILLGLIQGLIVSGLLFFSSKHTYANRILAVLILLISLASFNLYGNYINWFGSPLLRLIAELLPMIMPMLFGPLIYLYTQAYLEPQFRITKRQSRHFYPVLVDLVPSLTIVVFIIGIATKVLANKPGPRGNFIDTYNVYADIPRWLSITFYLYLSAGYLSRHKSTNDANAGRPVASYQWLNQFIKAFMVFQAIWFLYLVPYVIPRYTDWVLNTFDWYPVYIPIAVLVYWAGIKGYLVSQQQLAADKKTSGIQTPLSAELVEKVINSLIASMEQEKAFLNPALNLSKLSLMTGFPQKIVSTVLNQHLRKSFNEYVNEYRIKAFIERINLPELSHLTIAGIAVECGFNSQATFQRSFKETTGQSPSAFRKSQFETA